MNTSRHTARVIRTITRRANATCYSERCDALLCHVTHNTLILELIKLFVTCRSPAIVTLFIYENTLKLFWESSFVSLTILWLKCLSIILLTTSEARRIPIKISVNRKVTKRILDVILFVKEMSAFFWSQIFFLFFLSHKNT